MKRVLILTASFGDGHSAAAHNLCAALESLSNEVQVEVVDLFETSAGSISKAAKALYGGLRRIVPTFWESKQLDEPAALKSRHPKLGRLRGILGQLLLEANPDVVVSTFPAYPNVIRDLFQDHAEPPFRLVTVVTNGPTLDSVRVETLSDIYCVPDRTAAGALQAIGVPPHRIKVLGFPVNPLFSQSDRPALPDPGDHGPWRILYLVNGNEKKLRKSIKKLLEREETHLSIVAGRNAYLKAELTQKLARYGRRVQVVGWTNQIPHLLMTHHLVVGRAGGMLEQEAIAACCPMIAHQVMAGHEERYERWLRENDVGAVALKPRQLVEWVNYAFKRSAGHWRRWRENLKRISRPDASIQIAQLVLEECDIAADMPSIQVHSPPASTPESSLQPARQLLCDFHIHTNYSDGKLSVAEVIDFYGRRHFDCICITDHLADSRRLIGKLAKLSRLTMSPAQLEEYFEVIDRERQRAWRKYHMLVMAGLEFNKDGLTGKSSAHLLGIDLQMPIVDYLDLPETIAQIHAQGGLAVASHPHIMKSEWGKNTLYLWQHQDRFIPLIDAWEIANRNNVFNPVSAKRLPYLANSDFHKPKHIYSWKTLVSCEKNADAIKECIRKNERIAITLYRESESALRDSAPAVIKASGNDLVYNGFPRVPPLLPAA